jgi:elongation factor Ts
VILRERGLKLGEKRSDRETAFGRFGIYAGGDKAAGAMVELKCESAPVAGHEEFVQLANDLAEALANDLPHKNKTGGNLFLKTPARLK